MRIAALLVAISLAHAAVPALDFDEISRNAATARDMNRDDEAIRLYRQALEIRPSWDEGLWYLSTLLYNKANYDEAVGSLRRFVAVHADAGPGWVLLGLSEFQTRQYDRSSRHLERGLALGLRDRAAMARSAWYFVAALLIRAERFDEGLDLLFDAQRIGPPTTQLVIPAGLAALRLPLISEEVAPERRPVIELAGKAAYALYGDRKPGEAERLLKQLVAEYPNEPGVHFLHGAFLMDSRPADAIAEMRRELEISPNHLAARVRLVDEYLRENQQEAALPLARQAAQLHSDASAAHLALGQVLAAQGNLQEAIPELETARDEAPTIVRIRWALSRAYSSAGRSADAAREADEVETLKQGQGK